MKAYGGVDVWIHVLLTSAVVGVVIASRPCRLTTGEIAPGTDWLEGWISTRTSLDAVERRKILPLSGLEGPCHSSGGYTAAARVRARLRSCGICGDKSGTVAGFLRVLQFPLPIFIPPIAPQ
jgi:hypothetical protein